MIELENIVLSLGGKNVINGFSHTFRPGSTSAILGKSGCGKTTLLRIIAGLQKADSGKISVGGKISYVFQEPRLLPDRTALENINFVLGDKRETLEQAQKWLELAEMGNDGHKLPHELSGGMKQRIALVRALAYDGDIFLLDEPFSALDGDLKDKMITAVKKFTAGKTVILVTHDSNEAELLADEIITMD